MPVFDEPALPPLPSWGPANSLHVAVRVRLPQIDASHMRVTSEKPREDDEPDEYVRVSYRNLGPWRVVWDPDTDVFRWNNGPHAGQELDGGTDVERVAEGIGRLLDVGARLMVPNPPEV